MTLRFLLLPAVLLSVFSLQCAKNCTLVGCESRLDVRGVAPDIGAVLVDGAYALESSLEGGQTLRFDVEAGAITTVEGVHTDAAVLEDGALVMAVYGGFSDAPGEVELTLSRDGAVVKEWSAEPTWEAPFYPNGEDCDDEGCVNGEVEVSL